MLCSRRRIHNLSSVSLTNNDRCTVQTVQLVMSKIRSRFFDRRVYNTHHELSFRTRVARDCVNPLYARGKFFGTSTVCCEDPCQIHFLWTPLHTPIAKYENSRRAQINIGTAVSYSVEVSLRTPCIEKARVSSLRDVLPNQAFWWLKLLRN